jgi:hypothetical protein
VKRATAQARGNPLSSLRDRAATRLARSGFNQAQGGQRMIGPDFDDLAAGLSRDQEESLLSPGCGSVAARESLLATVPDWRGPLLQRKYAEGVMKYSLTPVGEKVRARLSVHQAQGRGR